MNSTDDTIEIDLQELFGLLLHWLWLIILCGILTGSAGFGISKFVITPQYESTTKVYILNKQDSSTITYSDMQLGTQLTKDYAQLIKSRDVLEQVITTCGLTESYGTFSERVEVENIADTRIIAITVRDVEPSMAQFIANEIRKVAAEHIKDVMDIQAVNVAEEANLPSSPASPNIMNWTVAGTLIGICICAMILIARFLMDDTIKTSEDVEKYLELSTLAMIPIMEEPNSGKKTKKRNSVSLKMQRNEEMYRSVGDEGDFSDVEDLEEIEDWDRPPAKQNAETFVNDIVEDE